MCIIYVLNPPPPFFLKIIILMKLDSVGELQDLYCGIMNID